VKRWLQAGFLILFVIACGCSGGDPRRMTQTDISLTIENSRFFPRKWIIPSGAVIHLSVDNPAGDLHTLIIMKGQSEGETDPNLAENQYWSVSIKQTTLEATFHAPSMPGEYRVVCSIDDHQVKGEQGILVVVIP